MSELVNETVQLRREWAYSYYIVNPTRLYSKSAWLVLPHDSYVYRARIESQIVTVVQVPLGSETTQFLLHHADSVIKALPSTLGR
jgi:hypothetical protein